VLSAQAEQPCGIVEADVLPDIVGERDAIDELAGFVGGFERVVRCEHDMLVAERGDGAIERLGRAHSRRRDDEGFLDVSRRRPGELDVVEVRSGPAVEAPGKERQRLAVMPQRKLRPREAPPPPTPSQPYATPA